MRQSEIVAQIKDLNQELNNKVIKKGVETIFKTISNELQNGNRIEVREFGVFSITKRRPMVLRNPQDGSKVEKPERNLVHFKMGLKLKTRLNKKVKRSKKR